MNRDGENGKTEGKSIELKEEKKTTKCRAEHTQWRVNTQRRRERQWRRKWEKYILKSSRAIRMRDVSEANEDAENYYSCAMKQLSHCLSNKSRTNKHWHIANYITRRKQSSGNFHYNEKVFHFSIALSVSFACMASSFCANANERSKKKTIRKTK